MKKVTVEDDKGTAYYMFYTESTRVEEIHKEAKKNYHSVAINNMARLPEFSALKTVIHDVNDQLDVALPLMKDTLPDGMQVKHGQFNDADGIFLLYLGSDAPYIVLKKDGIEYKQSLTEFVENSQKS